MLFYFSLGILVLTFGASLFWRRSFGNNQLTKRLLHSVRNDNNAISKCWLAMTPKIVFLFSIALIFTLLFYQSYQQYQTWSQNDVSKYLLPPYQSVNYFIFYVSARFFAPYLISLAAAILFFFSAKILNKKYNERFFEPEEYYFGAISLFLTSHPGWLFYGIFIIILYLIIHLYSLFIIHNSSQRLSLYHLWLPTAIFVIIIQQWLKLMPLWNLLKI